MKRLFKVLLFALVILAVAAAWVVYQATHPANHYTAKQLAPFLNAKEWTLYSIEPDIRPVDAQAENLQGYRVLGSQSVSNAEALRQVVNELNAAAERWDGAVAMCFNPRHGIRVKSGDKNYDMLICYECSQVYLYEGAKEVGIMYLNSAPKNEPSPKVLNDLLTQAGIKLPAQPKHGS